jgi:hypothetical protein
MSETETQQPKKLELEINELHRVKGHSSLFLLEGVMHRHQKAKLKCILDGREVNANYKDIIPLSNLGIHTLNLNEKSEKITVSVKDVIEKLFEVFPINLPSYNEKEQLEALMPLVVPGFDSNHFKHYDMKKILSWATDIRVVNNALTKTVQPETITDNTTKEEKSSSEEN